MEPRSQVSGDVVLVLGRENGELTRGRAHILGLQQAAAVYFAELILLYLDYSYLRGIEKEFHRVRSGGQASQPDARYLYASVLIPGACIPEPWAQELGPDRSAC
jgi:hypothetical protein